MPQWVTNLWTMTGGLLPILVALGFIIFVFAFGGDLLGLVAGGAKHLPIIGMNFGARLLGLGALAGLSLLVVVVFQHIPGAPVVSQFFSPVTPAAPAAVQTGPGLQTGG